MSFVDLLTWKLPQQQLTLAGYSKAADATFFYVPELKIQLDIGGIHKSYFATKFFLTHSHMDHAMYLPAIQPAFISKDPNELFIPKQIESYTRNFLHSAQEMNNSMVIPPEQQKPYVLHNVAPGEVHPVLFNKKEYSVRVIECFHSVPTIGYMFSEKRKKLKDEYVEKTGKEIAELRKNGTDIYKDVSVPCFAFLGDTTCEVFEKNPILFESPVIIVECTFLFDEHQDLARGAMHVHWKELEPYVHKYENVTWVLIHFSTRYKDKEIRAFFDALPAGKPKNVYLWIKD